MVIAEILRPRGNRGELLAKSQSDVPDRLERLKLARVRLADGTDTEVEIEQAWTHKSDWVLKFAGVDSINSAERFRRGQLWLPIADRGTLGDDEFFQSDLIGCSVAEKATGKLLGIVEGWREYGGPLLMEVRAGEREVLIPFVKSICCEVDLANRTIAVDLPDGLLEL